MQHHQKEEDQERIFLTLPSQKNLQMEQGLNP